MIRSTLTHCVSVSVNALTSQMSAQETCMLYLIAIAARPGEERPVAAARNAAAPMLAVPTAPVVQNMSQRLIPQFIRYDACTFLSRAALLASANRAASPKARTVVIPLRVSEKCVWIGGLV